MDSGRVGLFEANAVNEVGRRRKRGDMKKVCSRARRTMLVGDDAVGALRAKSGNKSA